MKKIIILLASLFVSFSVFAEPTNEGTLGHEDEALVISNEVKIIPKSVHDENKEQHYKIDASYPQLVGDKLPASAPLFNKIVSSLANQEIEQFKKYVAEDSAHLKSIPEELKNNTSLHIDYDVDVILLPNKQEIISVRLSIEGYQAGHAHPYHKHRVVNFDLENGKELALKDLFKSQANYLNVLSHYTNKKLNEKLEDKWMIAEGTKPLAKNFKNWNLEKDGILITFDEYQVAAYVEGTQEVQIPYSELKSVISPKAPIYACIDKSC